MNINDVSPIPVDTFTEESVGQSNSEDITLDSGADPGVQQGVALDCDGENSNCGELRRSSRVSRLPAKFDDYVVG